MNNEQLLAELNKAETYYRNLGLYPPMKPEPKTPISKELKAAIIGIGLGIGLLLGLSPLLAIEPVATEPAQPAPEPTPTTIPAWIEATSPKSEPGQHLLQGEASYYSIEGCLGCSPTLTMANGERLDDTVQTLALTPETVRAHKLLNKYVTVTNIATGDTTTAKVTDTGGFGKYGRVADLNLATKEAINCPGLCQVKIALDK